MRYFWEKQIEQSIIQQMQALLPDGYTLRGIAVQNDESIEGALIRNRKASSGGMEAVDAWNDIHLDAERIFSENRALAFPDGTEMVAVALGISTPKKTGETDT